jgi:NAD+ kinase
MSKSHGRISDVEIRPTAVFMTDGRPPGDIDNIKKRAREYCMKSFYLIVNYDKPQAAASADMVCKFLESHGATVDYCEQDSQVHPHGKPCPADEADDTDEAGDADNALSSEQRLQTGAQPAPDSDGNANYLYTDPASVPDDTDCILVFGGDGSIIQAARDLRGTDIPLLGINMGYLGYLAQLGKDDDIEKAMMELLLDSYTVESRMMLDGTIHHGGKSYSDIALNDIVLSKLGTNVARFELFINDRLIAKYSADGMIISTPTGSTAYNLSAGGPIAMPESELMILTPVAPHMLASRSIVLPVGSDVKIRIADDTRVKQVVSFDGDTIIPLVAGDTIDISISKKKTRLIQLDESTSFLDNINSRLK